MLRFYLHSTMFLLIQELTFPPGRKISTFTFHNVSINTYLPSFYSSPNNVFTFHNVSINTKKCQDELFEQLNLHSTMFLLIHSCIYISGDSLFSFTFHNVSINTKSIAAVDTSQFDLHSTMFLLILSTEGHVIRGYKKFTFHNVSINTGI